MNEDFYEFLYELRSSGFIHNSRKNSRLIFYRNSQQAERKTPFHLSADRDGEVRGNNLSGEMSSFSYQPSVNFRNTIIGIAFALNMHSMDEYVRSGDFRVISDVLHQQSGFCHDSGGIQPGYACTCAGISTNSPTPRRGSPTASPSIPASTMSTGISTPGSASETSPGSWASEPLLSLLTVQRADRGSPCRVSSRKPSFRRRGYFCSTPPSP